MDGFSPNPQIAPVSLTPTPNPSHVGRYIILIVCFIVIASIGTFILLRESGTPQEQYAAALAQEKEQQEYKVVYAVQMNLGSILGAGGLQMNVGLFKKGEQTKTVAEMFIVGQSMMQATYTLNGNNITCSNSAYSTSKDIQCDINKADSSLDNLFGSTNIPDLNETDMQNIVKLGSKTILGRKCDEFRATTKNMTEISTLLQEAGMDGMAVTTCFDRKTGVALEMNITTQQLSVLTGKTTEQTLMVYTATTFDTTVQPEEMALPVVFAVKNAGCTANTLTAVISPFKAYTGPLTVKIQNSYDYTLNKAQSTEYPLGTYTLKPGKYTKVEINFNQANTYSVTYDVCAGDECHSESCNPSTTTPDTCYTYATDQLSCEIAGCMYNEPLCSKISCYSATSEQSCARYSQCKWFPSYCTNKACSDFTTQQTCVDQADTMGCEWNGYSCATPTCYQFTDAASCQAKKACKWYNATAYAAGSCSQNYY